MKRKFFILSFWAILTIVSSAVAFAGDIKREVPKPVEPKPILYESELYDSMATLPKPEEMPMISEEAIEKAIGSIESLLGAAIRIKVLDFGKNEFNKWTDSKEYKLAITELENYSDDFDDDHIVNAIRHLEKELKQHPQNAYAEYYLADCKGTMIDNENEADADALRKEQLQHLSNCIDKLPSADVDSKIRVLLERSNYYSNIIFLNSKLTEEEIKENEEKSNKDILRAFELRPTYETYELIYNQNKYILSDDLKQEICQRILKDDPNNMALNLMLGDTYEYDDPEKALEYYNAACASGGSAKAFVKRAHLYVKNDDYSSALNDLVEANKRYNLAEEESEHLGYKTLEEESVDLLCEIAAVNEMWFDRVAKTCDNGTLSKYKNYILGHTLSSEEYYSEEESNDSYNKAITYLTKAIEENTIQGINMISCIQDLANCYVAINKVDNAVDVLFNNSDKLGMFISTLFDLEVEHELYDRCISDAKTLNLAGQIDGNDMLRYVGLAQFLKQDYNAVVETFNKYITDVRDFYNVDIPLSAFIEDGNIDFFYYACSLIITGKEKEGRELMSLVSDDEYLFIADKSKKILALHFAGREAEAIACLDTKIEENIFVDENDEPIVGLNDICLYTILGQAKKAKQLIGSVYDYDEQIDDLILELSDTPLIDLTEFKQMIKSN